MMRTFSLLACASLVALLVSCERPADTKNPAPPSSPTASATKPADPAKDPAMGDLKKATSPTSEPGKAVGATAKDLDPNAVLSPDMTPEKLKENVKTAPTDKLTAIADKIVASLEGAAAPGGTLEGAAKAAGLSGNLAALKEKLKVVVDELKSRGIDVSKYAKHIGI